ncbi:hypothetical protein GGR56DRAFT_634368 [Xylariaceae sp. FL0804]|nr:hypothetical protein GGR56DRAFT_634368 [Xylariaceae sp. FL0804]
MFLLLLLFLLGGGGGGDGVGARRGEGGEGGDGGGSCGLAVGRGRGRREAGGGQRQRWRPELLRRHAREPGVHAVREHGEVGRRVDALGAGGGGRGRHGARHLAPSRRRCTRRSRTKFRQRQVVEARRTRQWGAFNDRSAVPPSLAEDEYGIGWWPSVAWERS